MKRFTFLLSIIFCITITINAQTTSNRGDELMKQAQESLQQKELVRARNLYLQAYNSFSKKGDYTKAVECGAQAVSLYRQVEYYTEAFDLCRDMYQLVYDGEKKSNKTFPELHYYINKERFLIYLSLKRTSQAKSFLDKMEEYAKAAGNDLINKDFLYTQASYFYAIKEFDQGDACFQKLIGQYNEQKNYVKVEACYRDFIDMALQANNAKLVAYTYDKYIVWADSIKALTAKDELNALQKEYDGSLQTIQEKEKALSMKQYFIVGLCILAVILAGALTFGAIVLMRYIFLDRKQKKAIEIANEHNELKTQFIRNISTQMGPTLDTMDASLPAVRALHDFANHIQTLSELESTLSDMYEMQTIQVNPFCENIMDKVKGNLQQGVTTAVDAPKISVKVNPEQLERILLHLLNNAAEYTSEGEKITLEFKKRGVHTHQFIVTDTGNGIPVEAQKNLFKPFSGVKDLTQGDGLGLPICSLVAAKMNGTLKLDTTYTRGCRFILELHTK